MFKIIILSTLLCLIYSTSYANNNTKREKVNAVAMGYEDSFALHVSFTLHINNGKMDIQDMSLTHYLKDPDKSSIKVTKKSDCYYSKEFLKSYQKNKNESGIIKKNGFDVREIIFWCGNNERFLAYKIIPESPYEKKLRSIKPTDSNTKPLIDSKIVMFNVVGYGVITYEDVTSLGDPSEAIMARLEKNKPEAAIELERKFPKGSGPTYNLLNKTAPEFTPVMLDEKSSVLKINNLRDKVWVMVHYASWCDPCQPLLESLSRAKESSSATWVGVNYDTEEDKTNKMVFSNDLFDYLLADTNKEIATKYQLKGLPFIIIVSRQGIIRYKAFGISDLNKLVNEVTDSIEQLN